MPHDELLARIEQLEADNRRLATQVEKLTGPADEPTEDSASVPRRGLLKRVGGIALGVSAAGAAGQLLSATPAAADQAQPMILGTDNDSPGPTSYDCSVPNDSGLTALNWGAGDRSVGIYSYGGGVGLLARGDKRSGVIGMCNGGIADQSKINLAGVGGIGIGDVPGVVGVTETGTGVMGVTHAGPGVMGVTDTGTGVIGQGKANATGVLGVTNAGVGVQGVSDTDDGVAGRGSVGVRGTSTSSTAGFGVIGVGSGNLGHGLYGMMGPPSNLPSVSAAVTGDSQDRPGIQGVSFIGDAVVGTSAFGRGAVFSGLRGAVRLMPSAVDNHPTDGQTGDLFVDSTGRLWYCTQGGSTANWRQLA